MITPPNDRSWLRQATLVLAACEQGRDCALEKTGRGVGSVVLLPQ